MKRNVVLIGFMGTGKTSTGRELASRLGCAFVDLDQKIEADTGMSIPDIFKAHGEAYFRECERRAVAEIAERRGVVISTGGGTVKSPENVALLKKRGILVRLTADVGTILARTQRKGIRPVLDGSDQGDRRKAIETLLAEREHLYEQADYTVDTSENSPFQIIEDICRYLRRRGA